MINPTPTNTTERALLFGKAALVTDGATGIGESIVRLFHKHRAKVCVVDIDDRLGQELCQTLGTFIGMKHAARVMIPSKKGSIVSLSSVASVIGGSGPHAYTGSKHVVLGLTKSVAAELGQHGIRVNCVSPYAVLTDLALAHVAEDERTDDARAGFRAFIGRNANLQGVDLLKEDVANVVLFLASDEARYVSGDNLFVDGGFTCTNHALRVFR